MKSAIECIEDGVVVVDRRGELLFFNKAAERIVGRGGVDVPPEEWPSVYGCYRPDKVTLYAVEELPLVRAMRGEQVRDVELFIRNEEVPGGAWVSINAAPWYDDTGIHRGGVMVFRDTTAGRRSREIVHHLSKAVERTTDSVFITDADGRIEFVNPAFEATTGYAREEAVGSRPSILKSGRQSREYYRELWKKILSGEVYSANVVNRKKNGDLFQAEQTITPVHDEAGNLTHFVSVMRDVTDLKRAEEREVEMRLARIVQQKLYPSRAPRIAGLDVAGASFPADATCGDYFDFVPMSDGSTGVAVGDVSGHGFGPALLMAETRAYLRSVARTTADLAEILRQLNVFLCQDTEDDRFVTLMLVQLDPARCRSAYASAGHIPGYLLGSDGAVKEVLDSTGVPLGIFPGADFRPCRELHLTDGDLLVLLTDGVTESQNHRGEFFGVERALRVVTSQRQQIAQQIIDSLYMAIRGFVSRAPRSDDVTAVVCKVLSRWSPAETA